MSKFPKDFMWGASTPAYQVEGGSRNQWSEWEHKNAQRLAKESPRNLAWLPHLERIRSAINDPKNYISGRGIEHYQNYVTDFDILSELNMNTFRFGIEWARLEPKEGQWDESVIEHYQNYIAALQSRGIEPVLTMWHWTMPVWFAEKGGFERKQNLMYFERFAAKVAEYFAPNIRYILTLNEPNVYASFSYMTGDWPPQHKRLVLGFKVYRNLVRAHRIAYRMLKKANSGLCIGIADQLGDTRPKTPRNPVNRIVTHLIEYVWAWWFLDRIKNTSDFIGINYYFTEYRDWCGRICNPQAPVSDLGWYMKPSGIEAILHKTWKRYKLPLLITENGLADSTDECRQWWIAETIAAMERSIESGVELLGYLHWSLLDNFEWAYGWWPKFGLVAVDRTTMKRTIRPSARWFATEIHKLRDE